MENSEIETLIYSVFFILFALGFFLIATYFIFKKKQRNSILKIIELNQELLQTQIEIQEQTLANISQELHDNIGQSLTLAKLNLNTLPLIKDEKTNTQINNTKLILSNTLSNIRDLAKSMLGEKIAEIGIEAAIRNEVKLLEQIDKYKITLQTTGDNYLLPAQKEIVAFRIIQEALHNIIKHAEANTIQIQFNYSPQKLIVTLVDNGKGFDQNLLNAKDTGVGLKNMHNRAALINAKLNIQTAPFQGTSLTLSINQS
jgi:two-component system, NarL family, sensor kinase